MTKRILALLLTLLLPAAACAEEEWTSVHFDPTDRHGAVDCIFVLAHSHTENTGDKYTMQLEWAAVGGGEGEIRYAGELSMNEPSGLGYFYEQQRESVYWPVKLDMEGMIEPVIALLPETLEEARRFGDALARCSIRLPAWSEMGERMLSFPGAEGTVAVHLAPSAHSPRAADGKAAVALDEPFYYYGAEDGWLMIRYSANGGRVWRIGYIDLAALPQTGGLEQTPLLPFVSETGARVQLETDAPLTDDPTGGAEILALLPAGTEVTYLAVLPPFYGYVETALPGGTVRGLVPLTALGRADSPEEMLSQARAELCGEWKLYAGGGYDGVWRFAADGTFSRESEYAPGVTERGTWSLAMPTQEVVTRERFWTAPQCVLTCVLEDGRAQTVGITLSQWQGLPALNMILGEEGGGMYLRPEDCAG